MQLKKTLRCKSLRHSTPCFKHATKNQFVSSFLHSKFSQGRLHFMNHTKSLEPPTNTFDDSSATTMSSFSKSIKKASALSRWFLLVGIQHKGNAPIAQFDSHTPHILQHTELCRSDWPHNKPLQEEYIIYCQEQYLSIVCHQILIERAPSALSMVE